MQVVLQALHRCLCRKEFEITPHQGPGCDHEPKSRVGTRAEKAAVRHKRKRAQDTLEKVLLHGIKGATERLRIQVP